MRLRADIVALEKFMGCYCNVEFSHISEEQRVKSGDGDCRWEISTYSMYNTIRAIMYISVKLYGKEMPKAECRSTYRWPKSEPAGLKEIGPLNGICMSQPEPWFKSVDQVLIKSELTQILENDL